MLKRLVHRHVKRNEGDVSVEERQGLLSKKHWHISIDFFELDIYENFLPPKFRGTVGRVKGSEQV